MIPKKFIQVTLIYYDFTSAEMIAAKNCLCNNFYTLTEEWAMIGDDGAMLTCTRGRSKSTNVHVMNII